MSNVVRLPVGSDLPTIVAANVRAECARRGFNQSDLGRALGVSHTAINARWLGRRQWQLEDLDQVAGVLGIPVQRLFARSEGLEPPTFWLVDHRAPVVDIRTRERVA